jgi:hypothetical protein
MFPECSPQVLFGRPNIKKDGMPGKLTVIPPMEVLQTEEATRAKFISYSCRDAEATW